MPKNDPFITVVSGLPRSGTSMMMRLLKAGGMHPIKDDIREADEDNPNGYYELERVKRLKHDAAWVSESYGKAFKAIYLLLYDLPADHTYKVIFMTRRLEEVIASQDAMLRRSGKMQKGMDEDTLKRIFSVHLEKIKSWLADQESFEVIFISYNRFMEDPATHITRVNAFLGGGLDEEAMAGVVVPELYRQKVNT